MSDQPLPREKAARSLVNCAADSLNLLSSPTLSWYFVSRGFTLAASCAVMSFCERGTCRSTSNGVNKAGDKPHSGTLRSPVVLKQLRLHITKGHCCIVGDAMAASSFRLITSAARESCTASRDASH